MPSDSEIVTVFETGSLALLSYAKSVLDGAEIRYIVKGEQIQNMFGLGSLGGHNYLLGPMKIQVSTEDKAEAEELLAGITESDGDAD